MIENIIVPIIFSMVIYGINFHFVKKKEILKIGKNISLLNICINIALILSSLNIYIIVTANEIPLLWGICIFILVNIVIFIVIQKISKRTMLIIVVIVYFLVIFMIPIYKYEGHEHIFEGRGEVIQEYKAYYNVYGIRILKINL